MRDIWVRAVQQSCSRCTKPDLAPVKPYGFDGHNLGAAKAIYQVDGLGLRAWVDLPNGVRMPVCTCTILPDTKIPDFFPC